MVQYLCLFSLILQGLHEEGECRQLEFWTGKGANMRDLFCTTPKVLKSYGELFWNKKNIGRKKYQRGPTRRPQVWGARPTPQGAPLWLVGPLAGLRCPSSAIWRVLTWQNHKGAFGTKRRRLEAELGQNQSRAPAELFCRGNFPPGGGNRSHRHHQRSSHREGVNLHQHLHQHHLLSKP